MRLRGHYQVGGAITEEDRPTFWAVDPTTGETLDPPFQEADAADVDAAIQRAHEATLPYGKTTLGQRATFLEIIADEVESLGPALLERAALETGLPLGRFEGERGRTTNQLRMFASVVREGSWIDARIETSDPQRSPLPKADLRKGAVPLGPVAVFGASNFPLAFSVAGGDTASALAAGCPVVCKAHPNHPGTSEMVASAIVAAARKAKMPEGVFSLVQGSGFAVGERLVDHPLVSAVGFTGSLRGGRALFDRAARRPRPIPVYAEMSSVNPVFILPAALRDDPAKLATTIADSATIGVGQFCTKPGLVMVPDGDAADAFCEHLGRAMADKDEGVSLHRGILEAYHSGVQAILDSPGVSPLGTRTELSPLPTDGSARGATPMAFVVDVADFLSAPALREEVFGPCTVVVRCNGIADMESLADTLDGQLTGTIHAKDEEVAVAKGLIGILETRVGRLLFGGVPTGVEVCSAMHHGGPYPATTDSRVTSVGTAAIERFIRPICYQNVPHSVLPPSLRDENPDGILRMINGTWTRDPIP